MWQQQRRIITPPHPHPIAPTPPGGLPDDGGCYQASHALVPASTLLARHSALNLYRCRQLCSQRLECRGIAVDKAGCRLYKVASAPRGDTRLMEENKCHAGQIRNLRMDSHRLWSAPEPELIVAVEMEGSAACLEPPCGKGF